MNCCIYLLFCYYLVYYTLGCKTNIRYILSFVSFKRILVNDFPETSGTKYKVSSLNNLISKCITNCVLCEGCKFCKNFNIFVGLVFPK